jgi:hypothetical protein
LVNDDMVEGGNPLLFGLCDCEGVPCTKDSECAGSCDKITGTCVGQRVAMDEEGVPTCVKDTCYPNGSFVPFNIPPYTYGYCSCEPGYETSGVHCVKSA